MDKSEKYIEMCEKAEEIQEIWEPRGGDFTADHKNTNVMTVESSDLYTKTLEKKDIKKLAIWWLPRQDQLQEIIIKEQGWKLHPTDIKTLLHNICLSIEKGLPPFNKPGFYSMEQLWLAFVMKEKYKKTWDGKEWKK